MMDSYFEIENHPQLDVPAGPGYRDYTWQAQFGFQVEILPYAEWLKLKWGFNASALFDEFFERQKLFLESQYEVRHQLGTETPDYRTLAFRFINRPRKGVSVAVLGKIHAKSEKDARENARLYSNEVAATFPYDYKLVPARSKEDFLQISGRDILDEKHGPIEMAQIKRLEIPLSPVRNSPFLQGLWHSGPRTHEQVWRSLAAASDPVLLNVSLRCTVLYEKEREKLLKAADDISSIPEQHLNQQTLSAMQQWNKKQVDRRLIPWAKVFYLQVHLASPCKIGNDLVRTVGTSLTLNSSAESLPGYQIVSPGQTEARIWQKRVKNLDLIFSESYLPVPRLSEVADLEEVFAVVRLPYSPPEDGLPNVSFIPPWNEQSPEQPDPSIGSGMDPMMKR